MDPRTAVHATLVVVGIVVLALLIWQMRYLVMWLTARRHGVAVSYLSVLFMPLRKVDPAVVLVNGCMLARAGIRITGNQLEAHYLAGGDLPRVTLALVAARVAGWEDVGWNEVCAVDLAGWDNERLELARRFRALEQAAGAPAEPAPPPPPTEDAGPRVDRTPD